jgi:two-component system, cell cycle response regulator DivK
MKKILIIEDNEQNRYLMQYMLEKSGYRVIEAKSAEEGIVLLPFQNPDLILMDIQLPNIDGLEATRRIRASETDQRVPIVAVTSFAMAGDRAKAMAAGCTGYIEKPINPETFLGEVRKYI